MLTRFVVGTGERRWQTALRRFYLYEFIINFHLWLPIWVLYLQRERGFSLTAITALDAPFWLFIMACQVPTGVIADRWGRRRALVFGALAYTAAMALFAVSSTFWMLLGTYFVWALAMAFGMGADTAYLHDLLAASGRDGDFARVMGRVSAVRTTATLASALLGAPLAHVTSLSLPILLGAGVCLVAAVVAASCPEPPRAWSGARASFRAVAGEAFRYTVRHPRLRAMVALNALLSAAGMTGFIFLQPFLAEREVPVAAFGLFTVPGRLVAILAAIYAYRMLSRHGEVRVYAGISAGFILAMVVLGLLPSILAFPMFPLLSFCAAMEVTATANYVNRLAPDHLRATLGSVFQMVSSGTIMVIEPALGMIADRTSLSTAFLAGGLALSIPVFVALTWWISASRRAGEATPTEPVPV